MNGTGKLDGPPTARGAADTSQASSRRIRGAAAQ